GREARTGEVSAGARAPAAPALARVRRGGQLVRALVVAMLVASASVAAADGPCEMDPKDDEAMYNAAVCFEQRGAITAAVSLLDRLAGQFPRAELAPKAIPRSGMLYAQITFFDRAAP